LAAKDLKSAVDLYTVVQAASPLGLVVWMMTWGRRNGDPNNIRFYPDFLSMNARLETGYRQYANATSVQDPASIFAPVGLAFQFIYETDLQERGTDPANDISSNFYQLYNSDGSHPSIYGSYLAACVLYQVMTQLDPRRLSYAPLSMDGDTRNFLQHSAYVTVVNELDPTQSPVAIPPTTPAPVLRPTPGPTLATNPQPSLKPSRTPDTQQPTSTPSMFAPITAQPSPLSSTTAARPSATPTVSSNAPPSNPIITESSATQSPILDAIRTVNLTSSVPPIPSPSPAVNAPNATPAPSTPLETTSGSFARVGSYLLLLLGLFQRMLCWLFLLGTDCWA